MSLRPAGAAAVEGLRDTVYVVLVRHPQESREAVAGAFEAMADELLDILPDTQTTAASVGTTLRLNVGVTGTNSRILVRLHTAHARELERCHKLRQRTDQYRRVGLGQPGGGGHRRQVQGATLAGWVGRSHLRRSGPSGILCS